jgi:iron complex outermembrane receptor protein
MPYFRRFDLPLESTTTRAVIARTLLLTAAAVSTALNPAGATAASDATSASGATSTADATAAADAADAGSSNGQTPQHVAAASQSSLDGITVTGTHVKDVETVVNSGALGSLSILETPFSITAVNADDIATLGAINAPDVFDYDSSVKVNNSGVGSGNTFSVRGLALDRTNGYKIDGLAYPIWFQDMPLDHYEEVDLLKGMGGFQYGFATPGGILNYVTKQPTQEFILSADAGIRSTDIFKQHIDVGGPITADGDLGFRLNAVHESGTLYNNAHNFEDSVSAVLKWTPTKSFSWEIDGYYLQTLQTHQSNTISAAQGITYLAPPPGDLNLNATGSFKHNENPSETSTWRWTFAPDWTATLSYRHVKLDERFPGNAIEILDNAGEYASIAANIDRIFFYDIEQAIVEGKFNTGPLVHDVAFGASGTRILFDYNDPKGSPPEGILGISNLYTGVPPAITGNAKGLAVESTLDFSLYQKIQQNSFFVSDTLKLDPVSLIVGLRDTHYDERDLGLPGEVTAQYKFSPVTPTYAVTYGVAPKTNLYASYAEAVQTGTQAPESTATLVYTNANQVFGPIKSKQYEVGVKTAQGIFSGTAALFRIDQGVAYATPDPTPATLLYEQNGQARYQGLELNGKVYLSDDWTVSSSATYLDTDYLKGAPAYVGKVVPGTSKYEASAFTNYRPPVLPGLKLDGGVRYTGRGYGDSANLLRFPSATVFDLGAGYDVPGLGRPVTLRAAIQNVLDREYWVYGSNGAGGIEFSAGEPRTFNVNVKVGLVGL